jgi:uncharacterized protein (DUF1810 family)
MDGLDRFIGAQANGVFESALAELRAGRKQGHWMWFIFPQIAGLGRSETARFYAIANLAEARDYLAHPTLGHRLRECTSVMLQWAGRLTAQEILGSVDDRKFAICLTLLIAASSPTGPFADALDAFFDGASDQLTLERL